MNQLNLPTWLTISRFGAALALPVIFLLLDRPAADLIALAIFAVGAATDYVDGQLARRLRQESRLGATLDPVADKALVLVALAVLLAYAEVGEWLLLPVAIIFVRELIVSGLREYFGNSEGGLKVTWKAKVKTACQMTAIALLFLSSGAGEWNGAIAAIGVVMLWVAAVLTAVSGLDYWRKAMRMMEGRIETD